MAENSNAPVFDQAQFASRTAEDFSNLFYKNMDKRRSVIPRFYMDQAELVWNGHAIIGKESITRFFDQLPISEHRVCAMDAQTLPGSATCNVLIILITVAGMVQYGSRNPSAFTEFIVIASQDGTWKVATHTFRTAEPIC